MHTLKIVNSKVDVYFSVNATHVIGLLSDVTTRDLDVTSLSTTSCTWLAHSRVTTVTMQLLNTAWTSAEPLAASSSLMIKGWTTLTMSAAVGRIEAGTLLVETGAILTTSSISVGVLEVVAGSMRPTDALIVSVVDPLILSMLDAPIGSALVHTVLRSCIVTVVTRDCASHVHDDVDREAASSKRVVTSDTVSYTHLRAHETGSS